VSRLIKKQRKKVGMFQYHVAKKLGVSTKTLQRIESGQKEPTEEEYKKLAIIFNCYVLELRLKREVIWESI